MNDMMVVPLLVVGFFSLLVALSVFLQPSLSRIKLTFLFLTIAVVGWAWGIALFIVASSIDYAQGYLDLYYVSALAIASGVGLFAYDMTGARRLKVMAAHVVPLAVFVGLLIGDPSWLVEVRSVSGTLSSRVNIHQIPYALYAVSFTSIFMHGWWKISQQRLRDTGRKRRRHEVISFGIIFAGFFGALFNLILPWLGQYDYIAFGPLFSIIFTISITYAIARYSLFDLRRTFVISLAYLLASTTVALLYLFLVVTVGGMIARGISSSYFVTTLYVAFALLGVYSIDPLRRFFDRLTAKLFYRQYQTTEEVLGTFGDAILDDIDETSIVAKTKSAVQTAVRSSYVEIIRHEGKAPSTSKNLGHFWDQFRMLTDRTPTISLEPLVGEDSVRPLLKRSIGAVARMQLKDQLIGFIVAGDKRSGDSYNSSDLLLLEAMANEAALAISNSERFEEIQNFNERLAREIHAATKELQKSNHQLRELDVVKDEFISMASHQLRTPLTSVKGYISMLLDGDAGTLTPMQRKLLGEAFTSSERMVHLISDFLNVSRLQTGKFMLETHETDIAELIKQEVDGMKRIADTHGVKLSYRKPAVFPKLNVDDGKLRQVVMNFIDNAIFYSPDNTPVTVKASVEDGCAVVRVIDRGMGVPKEAQEKLFTKFFRADNARKQRPDGTGVGLFLAKKIVDAHGGSLIFESNEGKGSTFGFRLPIKKLRVDSKP